MDDVIITTATIFCKVNYQKLHHLSDPHWLSYTDNQFAIASSISIIIKE